MICTTREHFLLHGIQCYTMDGTYVTEYEAYQFGGHTQTKTIPSLNQYA